MKCHPGQAWLSKLCYSSWETSLFELLYLPQKTSTVTFVQTQNKHSRDAKLFVPTRKATAKVNVALPYHLWSADAGLNSACKIPPLGSTHFPFLWVMPLPRSIPQSSHGLPGLESTKEVELHVPPAYRLETVVLSGSMVSLGWEQIHQILLLVLLELLWPFVSFTMKNHFHPAELKQNDVLFMQILYLTKKRFQKTCKNETLKKPILHYMDNRLQFGLLIHHFMDSTTAYYQLLNGNNASIFEQRIFFLFLKKFEP